MTIVVSCFVTLNSNYIRQKGVSSDKVLEIKSNELEDGSQHLEMNNTTDQPKIVNFFHDNLMKKVFKCEKKCRKPKYRVFCNTLIIFF